MAEKIGYSHLDTDTAIANMHSKSIHEIFNDEGEDVFRKMEKTSLIAKNQCYKHWWWYIYIYIYIFC